MAGREVEVRSGREQVNLVLRSDSTLARRLRDAASETGQSRTQIVREIVEAFLDTWKRAEMAKRTLLVAPNGSAASVVLPVMRLEPRVRRGYVPEPGLTEVVAARRPLPDRLVGPPVPVRLAEAVRLTPRARLVTPSVAENDE